MSTLFSELSQDLNGNSQAAATRQKMAQLEQMLSALDQLRRVGVYTLLSPLQRVTMGFMDKNVLKFDKNNSLVCRNKNTSYAKHIYYYLMFPVLVVF